MVNPFSKASPDEKSGLAVLKSFPLSISGYLLTTGYGVDPCTFPQWGSSVDGQETGVRQTPLCNVREAPDSIAARPWTCHFLGVGPIGHLRGGDETESMRERRRTKISV